MGIERMQEFWPEWKVTELLGEGSYGKVYKAIREDHSLVSYCAIKIMSVPRTQTELGALHSEGMTDSESKEYLEGIVSDFINEIKLMETLKGTANIVSVEDYKILEKKNNELGWDIFIRMELLQPFSEIMAKCPPSEEEVIKLGVDICSALELCAKNNIIHRDIKPANIFISKNGDYKLGDFGIAKELGKTSSAMSSKGTYSYMAPEVANHKNYDLTVDIYSLGIVMYTLLNNNRQPFISATAPQVTYNDRMEAANLRLSGKPLPAPHNASKNLADIILTACAFDPAKRFRSAKAFKNALLNYQKSKNEVKAAPVPPAAKPNPVPPPPPQKAAAVAPQRMNPDATQRMQAPSATPVTPPSQKKKKSKAGLVVAIILVSVFLVISLIVGAVIAIPYILDSGSSETIRPSANDDDDDIIAEETYVPDTEYAYDSYEPETEYIPETEYTPSTDSTEDGLWWELNDGLLTITGNGAMPDYADSSETPWDEYRNDITTIQIGEGVTRVGNYSFASCYNCQVILLPSTLKTIGAYAFNACADVTELVIPEGVTTIDDGAFQSCWAVTSITLPSTLQTVGSYAFSFMHDLESVFVYAIYAEYANNILFDSNENLTIYCYSGSTMESYAQEKGFVYYTE